jgi:hypothetical protein
VTDAERVNAVWSQVRRAPRVRCVLFTDDDGRLLAPGDESRTGLRILAGRGPMLNWFTCPRAAVACVCALRFLRIAHARGLVTTVEYEDERGRLLARLDRLVV